MKNKYYKLPKAFGEKWLDALENGEFKQGTGYLQDRNTLGYCCLGVACRIENLEANLQDFGYPEVIKKHLKNIPKELLVSYNKNKSLPYILSRLNDGVSIGNYGELKEADVIFLKEPTEGTNKFPKHSFTEIAQFIRDNVEFY